jgi:hypothetical protein
MNLLFGRADEIEPQRAGHVRGRRMQRQIEIGRYEAAVLSSISTQHGVLRQQVTAAVRRNGS